MPFPVSESQAAVIAGVWSGRLSLPAFETMQKWEEERAKERGDGKTFHYMNSMEDAAYMDMLHEWAVNGTIPDQQPNGHNHNHNYTNGTSTATKAGKEPPKWGAKERWIRERIFEMKEKFNSFGEERHEIRTLEELGYDFEEWTRGQANVDEGDGGDAGWVEVDGVEDSVREKEVTGG